MTAQGTDRPNGQKGLKMAFKIDIEAYSKGMAELPLDDPAYLARCRAAFEAYLDTLGISKTPEMRRKQFVGYLHRESQMLWCTWCEALRFAEGKDLLPKAK